MRSQQEAGETLRVIESQEVLKLAYYLTALCGSIHVRANLCEHHNNLSEQEKKKLPKAGRGRAWPAAIINFLIIADLSRAGTEPEQASLAEMVSGGIQK